MLLGIFIVGYNISVLNGGQFIKSKKLISKVDNLLEF